MQYVYNYYTDQGLVKKINQDALVIMEAETQEGNILFLAVSDGMGGLSHGEEASARMVRALSVWFQEDLADLVVNDALDKDSFRKSMTALIRKVCDDIAAYSKQEECECGTTLTGVLIYKSKWYTVNVGDSRVYIRSDGKLRQITKDQTYVQRELDAGRMTKEEAGTHKMRSILLQCIGASDVVIPDWETGTVKRNDVFMLCSDGFRHVVSAEELEELLNPYDMMDEYEIRTILAGIADRSMKAGERDNISAIAVKVG